MRKTFTLDDLILYTYNEKSRIEKKELSQAIKENEFLRKQYFSFMKTKKMLECSEESPCESTISNILNLSKSLNVMKPDNFRTVEYIAN